MAGTVSSSGLFLLRLLSLFRLLSLLSTANASCYYPNGDLSANDLPCSDAAPNSGCCGQGFACLSNGICQATGQELSKPGETLYVRGSCTDKTWRSSYCPLFCNDPKADNTAGGMGIAKCPNTTKDLYRCINASTVNRLNATCDNDPDVLFFPGTPSVITTIGVNPTASSSTTSTASATSTTTSTTSASSTTSTTTSTTSVSSTTSTTMTTSVSSTSHTMTTSAPSSSHTTTTTSATTLANSIPTQPSKSSSPNMSAVIGGAIAGSLGGVGVLGLVVWSFVKRHRSRSRQKQEMAMHAASSQLSAAKFSGPVSPPGLQEAPDWSSLQHHHYPRASHKPAYLYEME